MKISDHVNQGLKDAFKKNCPPPNFFLKLPKKIYQKYVPTNGKPFGLGQFL